jgi:hypothetical protein
MTAKHMVLEFGEELIGRVIFTQPFGDWPGGAARVTELTPDPACPEIVMQVYRPGPGSIGVFDYERVDFVR